MVKKNKSQELDDLIAGEAEATAKPAGKAKKAEKPNKEKAELRAAEEKQLEEATLHAGEPPAPESDGEVANDAPEEPIKAEFPQTYDLEVGTVLRIPDDYGLRVCKTCKSQYVAPTSWSYKRCPPCVQPAAPEAAPATEMPTSPVPESLPPAAPIHQFEALLEQGGGVLEKVLAAAQYSSAFGLVGSIALNLIDGKVSGTSKFVEQVVEVEIPSSEVVDDIQGALGG